MNGPEMRRGNASDPESRPFKVRCSGHARHGSDDLEAMLAGTLFYSFQQKMTNALVLMFWCNRQMRDISHTLSFFIKLGNADHFILIIDCHKVIADRFVIIFLCALGMPPGLLQDFV